VKHSNNLNYFLKILLHSKYNFIRKKFLNKIYSQKCVRTMNELGKNRIKRFFRFILTSFLLT